MPEAASASFSARADSSLAVSWPMRVRDPRLGLIERWLRYAVPGILAVFLACLVGLAALHIQGQRAEILAGAKAEVEGFARLAARAIVPSAGKASDLRVLMPESERHPGRRLLLVRPDTRIAAAHPPLPSDATTLAQVLGDSEPLSGLGERAGAMALDLPGGESVLAAIHSLPDGAGQVAVLQPIEPLMRGWSARARDQIVLVGAAILVIVGVGLAYGLQSRQATRADRAREQIRGRLETALRRGACGLWDWDIARGRIYWSDSMYALLGYQRQHEYLSFGAVNALVHPDDGDLYSLARGLAAAQTCVDHAFRMRGADGAYVWLRARAEVMPDATDGGRHLVGIATDITEQRALEETNAASDMRLRDAVEAISEAFVLWDTGNRLVLCNSKFRHLHALSPEDAQSGRSYTDVMGRGVLPQVRRESPEAGLALTDMAARTFEAELTDGRWLQISERRTKDGGYVSVGTDITSLKRHQEQLQASERELIETVKDLKRSRRTLELQTQQLADLAERYLDQKAAAEAASQAKSEFLANMSHELRTPLNAIIGFADVMENAVLGPLGTPRYTEYCRDIRESGSHLLSMIDDILNMARLEARRVRLNPRPIPAEAAVASALGLVEAAARDKGIALGVDVQPGIELLADPSAMQQILANLVQNAVKFTPAGGRVAVRVRRAGASTHLFVEDSGIGIPRADLARLGRPFTQVEAQMTRSHKGSGLGLAITRSMVELHGGSLRIRSEETVGTVVLVRLPAPAAEQKEQPGRAAGTKREAVRPGARRSAAA
ncbi:PAS domain-containing sensor histidine kinase [Methylobacterium brachiatum]|uniref:PAS domain-containing sensor histidine kinase n=1 Tax=Methylobacterium brachiatum TaxID=269660 RepID=UPI0008E98C47|nr:PAS domain-containing sensor histidine kinase [Methylobacterium brachiatum]AYO81325.1 PAS domain S-box protein [Methylobacterium brachiatum]CAA2160940.1 Non-motile and phage-resistance protein [Methylobacterium brachiatum]SFJ13395.1 two-component system, cell cycle sensor histidine kinase PleC [Methylobacterium brachiatum]